MEAWKVTCEYEPYPEIVFAKARLEAACLALSIDSFSEYSITDIKAQRLPQMDKYYKDGKWLMDWDNPEDRLVMVKECGFNCGVDYFEPSDCEKCSAKDYCNQYADVKGERG